MAKEKFDLYESGTYSVFQYSGQKLALPQGPTITAGHDEAQSVASPSQGAYSISTIAIAWMAYFMNWFP